MPSIRLTKPATRLAGRQVRRGAMTAGSVFVSTYPPRRCGVATFTRDLAGATGDHEIAVLHPSDGPDLYPIEVRHRIRRDVRADYLRIARALNRSDAAVVSIQHEFGIWGGDDGEYVLDFLAALNKPIVTTLHTVPQNPSAGQRRVLTSLIDGSAASVVMSRSAAGLLGRGYGIGPGMLDVVPHGVPNLQPADRNKVKPKLGLETAPMILSFGLLGPGKGCESVIQAMPAVTAAEPTAYYVILGATHPELLRREGEAYRHRLMHLAEELGVSGRVLFVDRYVTRSELGTWLTAADIFVAPYPNPDQIVSGTLAYAMSAGLPIVSTRYIYAVEMLGDGRGRLVEFGSPGALAASLIEVLLDPELRGRLGRLAYEFSRNMIWPVVGARYRRIFERVAGAADRSVAKAEGVGAGNARS
jgi:glycosyltransferase involved in cell wall biosynthesis